VDVVFSQQAPVGLTVENHTYGAHQVAASQLGDAPTSDADEGRRHTVAHVTLPTLISRGSYSRTQGPLSAQHPNFCCYSQL